MACNSIESNSSARMIRKYYDVFVSFHGKDTRNNFTDFLFVTLQRKGIIAFRDDRMLKKGKSIESELFQTIEGSRVLVVVFSKNYAFSTWCLRELAKIYDCFQVSGKPILPIFYDVDPAKVRKQSGDYKKAFVIHEKRFKNDLEKMVEMKRWREALREVANLSGWDIRNKPQYKEIEKIVEQITSLLGHKFSSLPNDIIGIQTPLEELEKHLLLSSMDDVRVVGICGMGGIGKTTLTTVLYERISHQYDACCFIDDVSKVYRSSGLEGVQKRLLDQIMKEENLQISNLYDTANLIRSRLHHVKALIFFDNVDQIEQLEKLVVNREWLGAGSRIIIISRDEHILKVYGVDIVYKVAPLNWHNSIQLFCGKAFKSDDIRKEYKKLTYDILEYANGLPLAIKVLSSFLFDRDIPEWRSALARLKENPDKDIMDVLQLSFDGLQETEKEIFLDIACFFNGHNEQYVKKVLNCCGFHADIGIKVLIDKSLISIMGNGYFLHNRIEMHDLLKQLGRKIVQENSTKESRKWSRLWHYKYLFTVMSKNMEDQIEAIVLNGCGLKETEMLMAETVQKMSHLRLLILIGVKLSGSLNCLSNELRYVEWHKCPFMYLPSLFKPYQLVELILEHSSIKQLWEGKKYLPSLRTLNLSHSKNLIKMPDFEDVPNLEWLNLEGCVKLVQVDPSIGLLRKLIFLNLKDCRSLASIPNIILKSTSSILKWITLPFHFLYPRAYKDSGSTSCLLPSLPDFSCLLELDISFCGLSQIPDAIGCICFLEILNLGGNNFVKLPSLKELSKLVCLNLQHCKQLKSLPELPSPINLPLRRQLEQDHRFTYFECWRLHRAGMYIFNCPKLGERENCNSMTFSWMTRVIQENQESTALFDVIDIVIPGSEIPQWFNNQSVGSSMSMSPSPTMHDNNCIGVVCCAVFLANGDPTTLRGEKHSAIGIGFRRKECCSMYAIMQLLLNGDLITDKSDHLFLVYFTREKFFNFFQIDGKMRDLGGIELDTLIHEGQGLHLKVKNCGYSWIYKEDLKLFNITTMHNRNPSTQKRKFLAIEDEAQAQP